MAPWFRCRFCLSRNLSNVFACDLPRTCSNNARASYSACRVPTPSLNGTMSTDLWPNVAIIRPYNKVVECVKAHIKSPNFYKKQNIAVYIYQLYTYTIQRDVDTSGDYLRKLWFNDMYWHMQTVCLVKTFHDTLTIMKRQENIPKQMCSCNLQHGHWNL